MNKVLLVYSPFCSPVSPPYSIANLNSFLKCNSKLDVSVLDLNLEFHINEFSIEMEYFRKNEMWNEYDKYVSKYNSKTMKVYSDNNKKVRFEEKPDLFDSFVERIVGFNPEVVAFSVVYSSQVFYTYALVKELSKRGVKCVVGGPAVNHKLIEIADFLFDEIALLEYCGVEQSEYDYSYAIDYSIFDLDKYFIPETVLPLKTSSTCYYKQCAFCSHFSSKKYEEYSIENLERTVKSNEAKYYFLIDDMIHPKRLLEIGRMFKKHGVLWICQLRPTADFNREVLAELYECGLRFIIWGVESGNNRILKLISKGTNVSDISNVLRDSHEVGIGNVLYVMFGFPSETEIEFMDTVKFLKDNSINIDLISSSVFGLQMGTKVYDNPEKFSISNINVEERSLLEPKVSYEVSSGLSNSEAAKLRRQYMFEMNKINKYPFAMNFFREHMFFWNNM